jgi:hypothetical protein
MWYVEAVIAIEQRCSHNFSNCDKYSLRQIQIQLLGQTSQKLRVADSKWHSMAASGKRV